MRESMTVFLTILAGVSTFVLGQILLKLILEPVQDLKRTISRIAHHLSESANVYANPKTPDDEKQAETSQKMRELSSALCANMYLIPNYDKI